MPIVLQIDGASLYVISAMHVRVVPWFGQAGRDEKWTLTPPSVRLGMRSHTVLVLTLMLVFIDVCAIPDVFRDGDGDVIAGHDANADVCGYSYLGATRLLQIGHGGEREECHRGTRPPRPYAGTRYSQVRRVILGDAGTKQGIVEILGCSDVVKPRRFCWSEP